MALSTLFSTVFTTLFVLATATQDSRLSVPQQLNHQHKPTTDWPSLIFHFTLKRSSVNIYGQKNFDMAANPVLLDNESNILYDVFATFSPLYNYTLVGGVAYLSTSIVGDSSASVPVVKCLESESEIFPPINIIVAALNEARLIPSAGTDIQCSSTNLYKVSVNGVDFADSGFEFTVPGWNRFAFWDRI
uniref:Uncharacterized protein n=1 Tax=Phytophthora ramorum TaxID=164328 RepID=H3GV54_PHYRM